MTIFDQPHGERGKSLGHNLLELIQDLLDHLPVFQADGQKDGFHRPGMSHVNSGTGLKFGPAKVALINVAKKGLPLRWKIL